MNCNGTELKNYDEHGNRTSHEEPGANFLLDSKKPTVNDKDVSP